MFSRSANSLVSTYLVYHLVSVQRFLIHSLCSTTLNNKHTQSRSPCLHPTTKSLAMAIPLLTISHQGHGLMYVENVLGNSLPNQPGTPIMKGAIDQKMEQLKHQDASMTLILFQLEQMKDKIIQHKPTNWQPICLTTGNPIACTNQLIWLSSKL